MGYGTAGKVHLGACGYITDIGYYGTLTSTPTCNGTGGFSIELNGRAIQFGSPTDSPALQTYIWLLAVFTKVDDVSSDYLMVASGGLHLYAKRVDATNYHVELREAGGTVIGTGATNFAWGANTLYVRIQSDGSTAILEASTTTTMATEVSGATANILQTSPIFGDSTKASAGKYLDFQGPVLIASSTTTDDRPEMATLVKARANPASVTTVLYNEATAPSAADVDDWNAGGALETVTPNIDLFTLAGAQTKRQSYDTDDGSGSDPSCANVRAHTVYGSAAQSSGSKTCSVYMIQTDGTNAQESSIALSAVTSYSPCKAIFNVSAAGNTTWDLPNMEIGVRMTSSNTLNGSLNAVQGELVGFGLDPVPTSTVTETTGTATHNPATTPCMVA